MNKKLTPICHALALALCAALTAPSAHADALISSATASITNLRYRLIDLDLTDGITPGLSINGAWIGNLNATGSDGASLSGSGGYRSGVLPFSNNAAVVTSLANGVASTTIGGSELTASSSLYQSNLFKISSTDISYGPYEPGVTVSNQSTTTYASSYSIVGSNPTLKFQVTAHTLLVVEGTYNSSIYVDRSSMVDSTILVNGPMHQETVSSHDGFGNVDSGMSVVLTDSEDTGNEMSAFTKTEFFYDQFGFFDDASGLYDADTAALTKTFASSSDWSTQIANSGNGTKTMFLTASVGAVMFSKLTHVNTIVDRTNLPEPGTYALMGLGLVGMSLVRRRQAA